MVLVIMMQQQTSSALASHPISSPPTATTTAAANSLRTPTPAPAPAQSQLPSPLSLAPLSTSRPPPPPQHSGDHAIGGAVPIAAASPLPRVRLSDIASYDGAPTGPYLRAVEALSGSLMRNNAAVIELGSDDVALMRCGLEAARLYFRSRAQQGVGKGSRGVYMYRAGR